MGSLRGRKFIAAEGFLGNNFAGYVAPDAFVRGLRAKRAMKTAYRTTAAVSSDAGAPRFASAGRTNASAPTLDMSFVMRLW